MTANGLFPEESRLIETLAALRDPQSRLAWIVRRARDSDALTDAERTSAQRIDGCLSNLWVIAAWQDEAWRFRCDSDSFVVKGFALLICESCRGVSPPDLILRRTTPPLILHPIVGTITQSRRLGLHRFWERIVDLSSAPPPRARA